MEPLLPLSLDGASASFSTQYSRQPLPTDWPAGCHHGYTWSCVITSEKGVREGSGLTCLSTHVGEDPPFCSSASLSVLMVNCALLALLTLNEARGSLSRLIQHEPVHLLTWGGDSNPSLAL